MKDLQKIYIRNQILTMPMKVNHELTYKNRKFNKRSDYDNIIKYVDKFIEAMIPCKFCNDACYAGEYPCPWDDTKRGRLKNVIMK